MQTDLNTSEWVECCREWWGNLTCNIVTFMQGRSIFEMSKWHEKCSRFVCFQTSFWGLMIFVLIHLGDRVALSDVDVLGLFVVSERTPRPHCECQFIATPGPEWQHLLSSCFSGPDVSFSVCITAREMAVVTKGVLNQNVQWDLNLIEKTWGT